MVEFSGGPTRRGGLALLGASLLPVRAFGSGEPPPATRAGSDKGWTELNAVPRRASLGANRPETPDLWGFEGQPIAPVLRLNLGDELAVRLRNGTSRPLSLHWHGVRGPNAMDGIGGLTQAPVPPGGAFEYRFSPPDAGTFLIRPIVLGGSSEPAGRGLGGLLIVGEKEAVATDGDYALLIRDWRLAPDGALEPFGSLADASLAGRLGNRITVGDEAALRRLSVPAGARLRLRLVNGCNARIMRLRFDGLRVFVAAVDGQPTETFEPLRATLPFAPGSRYDLLLDMPADPGASGSVLALIGAGETPLLQLAAAGSPAAAGRAPIRALPGNPRLPPEIKLQNAVRRDIAITGGATRGKDGAPTYSGDPAAVWQLNGSAGRASGPPLFTARRGQPVVLAIANRTGFVQALHLSGHVFRLLHALDDGWEPYWLDTLQVPEGKTVHIAFVADNPGRWLLGASVLERLDAGLWGWFEVT